MKFMTTWSIPAATLETAQQRFVEKGGQYGEVKLLGQWHSANGVQGWSIVESDSAMAINTWLDAWADLLDITITPVVEAEEAAGFLTKKFSKS
jgi:hypothetical protein